jgi:hypothetical protein
MMPFESFPKLGDGCFMVDGGSREEKNGNGEREREENLLRTGKERKEPPAQGGLPFRP